MGSAMTFNRQLIVLTLLINSISLFFGCGRDEVTSAANAESTEDALPSIHSAKKRDNLISDLLRLTIVPAPFAGIKQFGYVQAPVVWTPEIDNEIAFFQIIRCSEGSVNAMMSSNPQEDSPTRSEHNAEIDNNKPRTWDEIKNACQFVSGMHPQKPFVDVTAGTGLWRWFLRICATRSSTDELACNPHVLKTRNSIDFSSRQSSTIAKRMTSVAQRSQTINQLTNELQQQAMALGLAFEQCDRVLWKKAENLIKRSIIANIVGYGAALLIKIYGNDMTSAAKNGEKWSEVFRNIWQNETSDQKAIVRTLLWLFTSNDDFSATCMPAEKIKIQANLNLLRLKEQQILLASEMDLLEEQGIPISQVILK